MTTKLEQAARQALEALREYRDTQMISAPRKAIEALREALAEQADEIDWIKTNKALAKEIIEMKKQAEQEPVAWMDENGWASIYKDDLYTRPLYTAPVRTKDLTDVDLWKLWEKSDSNIAFARAVIAADREKNK